MNYLVHLYLSDPQPLVRLGNLMGDFVKGRLEQIEYPPDIIRGLRQHRAVDSYSQHSPAVRRSKERIDPRFGYFRNILIDVFYDHFLARDWAHYSDTPLEEFAAGIYRLLRDHRPLLPPALQDVADRMIRYDWLVSYREAEVMRRALARIGQRLSRPNPLPEGYDELLANYEGLQEDCAAFLAEAHARLQQTDPG